MDHDDSSHQGGRHAGPERLWRWGNSADRFRDQFTALSAQADESLTLPDRLCRAVVEILPVDSACLSLMLAPQVCIPVGASDVDAVLADRLEFTLGEGPHTDSCQSPRPSLFSDIAGPPSLGWIRWPTYTAELRARTRFVSVFIFPLSVHGSVLGSLHLYRCDPGTMGDAGEGLVLASLIADRLLGDHRLLAGPQEHDVRWLEGPLAHGRYQVWRAQGLVMRRNRLDPEQALDLLRARALTDGCLLEDIAEDILSQRAPVPDLKVP